VGGTLVISNELNNHSYYKKLLEGLGFPAVTATALERDALNSLIRDMEPDFLIIDARFYECCTPFLMKGLKGHFPQIEMVAVAIGRYPVDLAMYFILNGARSYLSTSDGFEDFLDHLADIGKGGEFISPEVIERINLRREYPMPAGNITDSHYQIILLICNGFKDGEIAETLYVTRRTVTTHKTQIFTALNVRNANELIRVAQKLEIVTQEGMYFYTKNFVLNPLPNQKPMNREQKTGSREQRKKGKGQKALGN
jgi:two-component system invasion response regulator UvrY